MSFLPLVSTESENLTARMANNCDLKVCFYSCWMSVFLHLSRMGRRFSAVLLVDESEPLYVISVIFASGLD